MDETPLKFVAIILAFCACCKGITQDSINCGKLEEKAQALLSEQIASGRSLKSEERFLQCDDTLFGERCGMAQVSRLPTPQECGEGHVTSGGADLRKIGEGIPHKKRPFYICLPANYPNAAL